MIRLVDSPRGNPATLKCEAMRDTMIARAVAHG